MTNLTPDPNSSEHADLTARLQSLGQTPVEPALASAHLTAMANVQIGRTPRPVRARFVRSRVVAAFAAGLLLGGTSLASAGVLGATPQNTVADAAAHVGVDLPGGTPRSIEGCGGNTYKNHGQFVSQGGDPHSQCGKPLKSAGKAGKAGKAAKSGKPDKAGKSDDANGKAGTDAGKGCGKPPWAGKGNQAKKTAAAVAARNAQCGNDGTDSEGKKADVPAARGTGSPRTTTTTTATPTTTAATTTTFAPTTTTIAATTTTMATTTTT
jgi:hypothetical protein